MKEGKKWKCAEPGIDAAYVILQLEKQSKITGIDIGNEGSAFVTVFVGKSGWTDDRYKVNANKHFHIDSNLQIKNSEICIGNSVDNNIYDARRCKKYGSSESSSML